MATDDAPPEVPEPDPEARKAWLLRANVSRLTDWGWKHLCVRGDHFIGYFRNRAGELVKFTKPKKADVGTVKLTQADLRGHFAATGPEHLIGGHSLTAPTDTEPQGVGRWTNNDWDNHGGLPLVAARNLRHAVHVYRKATGLGFRPLLCTWGTGGFHLWVFFEGRVAAPVLHAFAAWLVADAADFGFSPPAAGDPASGWPESNPKQPAAKAGKLPSAVRFPGRHHTRDVWPIVFDGAAWVQGAAAVAHVLSLTQVSAALIPEVASPGAVKAPVRKKARPPRPHRPTDGPELRVVCDAADVFRAYNRGVTLDMVVAMHEQLGHHPLLSQTAARAEFGRAGAEDGGNRFNVEVRDGVPITFNFSPNAGLPANDGLSPAEVRCFYATRRIDTAAMREFAAVLRQELGVPYRAEPQTPSWSPEGPPAGGPTPTEEAARAEGPEAEGGDAPSAAPPKPQARFTASGYTVAFCGTFHCVLSTNKETGEVVVASQTKLANFNARIVSEVVTDDGAEQTRELLVEALHPSHHPVIVPVPVEKFAALDWVVEQLGPRFIIHAGKGVK
ncbi:MAG TPA: hypothetical protein VH092_34120, partial [Urbifossiella sp.]|nr:hypothetical protein [Urbifossiella sp.]